MSQKESVIGLSVADYAVFGLTLGISAAIGIFFAIKDRKSPNGIEGYMLGGRKLGMVPIAFSLTVSYMSAITVLGISSEVYVFGTMYAWYIVSTLITAVVTAEVYIPVFYKLHLLSTFEYLERRFNQAVRFVLNFAYLITSFLYLGIIIYAPSLALSAVTGFNLWGSILSTGLVCIFYTTLGGIKAVVWTDVFQAIVMVMGCLAVVIEGCVRLGGYSEVWKVSVENGRIDLFHFELDPRIRHTVWSITVGGTLLWVSSNSITQAQVQRYISCKTEAQAKGSVFLSWMGMTMIYILCLMIGTISYGYFYGCDPISTGKVAAADQLFPYLTLQLFANYPGVSGLVVSCLFSGSLSTISSGINAMSCVMVEDFVKPYTNLSENKYLWISKVFVIALGGLTIGTAYLASQLGGILQAALSVGGITGGPNLAIFVMGLHFPFTNSYGAFIGYLSGIGMNIWVYLGSRNYPPGQEFVRKLPVSTEKCSETMNNLTTIFAKTSVLPTQPHFVEPPIAELYHVSYAYYSCIGFAVAFIVGLIVSLITCGWKQRKQVDPVLLHFFFDHGAFKWLPEKFRDAMRFGINVDDSNKIGFDEKSIQPGIDSEKVFPVMKNKKRWNDCIANLDFQNKCFKNSEDSIDQKDCKMTVF